jgi:hypothetical protein
MTKNQMTNTVTEVSKELLNLGYVPFSLHNDTIKHCIETLSHVFNVLDPQAKIVTIFFKKGVGDNTLVRFINENQTTCFIEWESNTMYFPYSKYFN